MKLLAKKVLIQGMTVLLADKVHKQEWLCICIIFVATVFFKKSRNKNFLKICIKKEQKQVQI